MSQLVKNLPAMQEIWIWSLDQEDPLGKGMQPTPVFFAWRTPWTEEPEGLHSMGSQRVRHDWVTTTHTCTHKAIRRLRHWDTCKGEGDTVCTITLSTFSSVLNRNLDGSWPVLWTESVGEPRVDVCLAFVVGEKPSLPLIDTQPDRETSWVKCP